MTAKKVAQVIQFPLERRMEKIRRESIGQTVVGTAQHSGSVGGSVGVTLSSATVTGSPVPAWLTRVPPISTNERDRMCWVKVGALPTVRAKRHRITSLSVEADGSVHVLTACGRRAVLGRLFDDPFSSGDCAACRARGWR